MGGSVAQCSGKQLEDLKTHKLATVEAPSVESRAFFWFLHAQKFRKKRTVP